MEDVKVCRNYFADIVSSREDFAHPSNKEEQLY